MQSLLAHTIRTVRWQENRSGPRCRGRGAGREPVHDLAGRGGRRAHGRTVLRARLLASRSHWRLADLAAAPGVASSAGRMCARLARKGLVRTHRASRDRRAVLISATAAGRKVAEEAAGRQRALVAGILARFPAPAQRAVAEAFRDSTAAAGEVPGGRRPQPAPGRGARAAPAAAARPGSPVPQVPSIRARAQEQQP